MVVTTYEELRAAAIGGRPITLGDHIEIPQSDPFVIPEGQELSIDLAGYTLFGSQVGPATSNYALVTVGKNSILHLSNGGVLLSGEGDGTFAYCINAIEVNGGFLTAESVLIQNSCPTGICSCVDVIASLGNAEAEFNDVTFIGGRYATRQFSANNSLTNKISCIGCNMTMNSSGPFLHNAGSNSEAPISITLKDTTIVAPRGIYIWDCNKGEPENQCIVINLEKNVTVMASATPVPGGDDFYPGYEGEVMVDYSGGQHAKRVLINDKRHTHAITFTINLKDKIIGGGRKINA